MLSRIVPWTVLLSLKTPHPRNRVNKSTFKKSVRCTGMAQIQGRWTARPKDKSISPTIVQRLRFLRVEAFKYQLEGRVGLDKNVIKDSTWLKKLGQRRDHREGGVQKSQK